MIRSFAIALSAVLAGMNVSFAQTFPTKPVRIVTAAPGGGADFIARLVAQEITGPLGQPVIVDNRAAGLIPGQVVSQSAPDGYTLLLYGPAVYLETLMRSNAPYDAQKDLTPITLVTEYPNVLFVHPSLPATSVKELIALAKAKPGALNYASTGVGSTPHLTAELFKSMAGVNIVHVPYKSIAQGLNDLLAGQVQIGFSVGSVWMAHVKSGKLRALAVTSLKPSPLFPGLPAVAETVPGYEQISISGLWAPAKTPAAVITRLNQEVGRALNKADVKEKFFNSGQEATPTSPEEFNAWLKTDITRLSKIIKDAGIKED